jgi:hypothetical protein
MKTQDYLDQVKVKLSLPSDYAVAKVLHLTRGAVSALRLGKAHFSDMTALRVSEILGVPFIQVVTDCYIERAREPEVRAAWVGVLEKISVGFEKLSLRANRSRALRPGLVTTV